MAKRKKVIPVLVDPVFNVTTGHVSSKYESPFKWKIENFPAISLHHNLINDQRFSLPAGKSSEYSTQWECDLFETHPSVIAIRAKLKTGPSKYRAVGSFSIQITKPNEDVGKTYSEKQQALIPGKTQFIIYIGKGVFQESIWEDGSIVIEGKLQLDFYARAETLKLSEEVDEFEKMELRNLSQSFRQMIGPDIQPQAGKIIKVVSGDKLVFYADTAILARRSDYFKLKFDPAWMRNQDSLVLEDLSGKTLQVLLHYLIGGVLLDEDWKAQDVILELTYAAEMCQLEELKEFLDKVLPAIPINDTEILAKLTLLVKKAGMKNAEKELFSKLKETVDDVDQLLMDKKGNLLGKD